MKFAMPEILVVDYDPAWPQLFEQLRARVWSIVSDHAITIEHVGSTAVAGLAAKPVIDMTIVVPDAQALAVIIERLEQLGYTHRGDLGVPGREAFAPPEGAEGAPAHHLYACVEGNTALRNHLAVRDHLRRHPQAARAYGQLKRQLAARFPHDIAAYIEGKTPFVQKILAEAGFTDSELAQIRAINRKPPP